MLQLVRRSLCKRVLCPQERRCIQWFTTSEQVSGRKHHHHKQPEHADSAHTSRDKRRRDSVAPVSIFLSPTSEWKDHFRAQVHARNERSKHSPFVQRAYNRFVRTHPDLKHCGLAKFRPVTHLRSPWLPQRRLPAFSYLKDRLHKKNHPQATARRNSLLRSRQHTQPLEVLLRPRARRRRPRQQKSSCSITQYLQPQALRDAMVVAWKERLAPTKKPLMQRIRRRKQ